MATPWATSRADSTLDAIAALDGAPMQAYADVASIEIANNKTGPAEGFTLVCPLQGFSYTPPRRNLDSYVKLALFSALILGGYST